MSECSLEFLDFLWRNLPFFCGLSFFMGVFLFGGIFNTKAFSFWENVQLCAMMVVSVAIIVLIFVCARFLWYIPSCRL